MHYLMLQRSIKVGVMLKEWIRNLPLERLLAIVNNMTARGGAIWRLATVELTERQKVQKGAVS